MSSFFIILTWHPANVIDNTYAGNDLIAFSEDLRVLDDKGWTILPLTEAQNLLRADGLPYKTAVLTIDDGSILDFRDFQHPSCGHQVSIFNRLSAFSNKLSSDSRQRPHVSSFVIASPQARAELEQVEFMGLSILPDDWWRAANHSNLMAVENHSWDHNHDSLSRTVQKNNERGDFRYIDTADECEIEVGHANDFIERVSGRRPRFFAYPFGQSSDYLRSEYLPRNGDRLGLIAALGCEPEPVTSATDPWFVPRYVCGRDWRSSDDFSALLDSVCS